MGIDSANPRVYIYWAECAKKPVDSMTNQGFVKVEVAMGHLTKLPIFTYAALTRVTEEVEVEEADDIAFVQAGALQRS